MCTVKHVLSKCMSAAQLRPMCSCLASLSLYFFFVLAAVLLGKQHVHEEAIVMHVTVILG